MPGKGFDPASHPLAPAFPVMAAVFVGYLVVGMALPVLPLHVHDDLGFGPFVVGLVSGGQFLAALASRLWAGHLADTRGSRHAVLVGLGAAIGGGGCYLLSLLFPQQPVLAVSVILIGRILLGGAESLIITGGISWELALLPANMAGKAIAWVGMAMFAAMAAGSPVGDLVYRHARFGGSLCQHCSCQRWRPRWSGVSLPWCPRPGRKGPSEPFWVP
jgi:MFS family permease